MGDYIERQKRMLVKEVGRSCKGFFLIAIRKDSVVFRQKFELKSTAIGEAKNFWVNKGFLAVEVFHIESGEDGDRIAVDYHGLRNY